MVATHHLRPQNHKAWMTIWSKRLPLGASKCQKIFQLNFSLAVIFKELYSRKQTVFSRSCPQVRDGQFCFPFFQWSICIIFWNSSAGRDLSLLPHLLIYSLIYLLEYGLRYLFYTLMCNPILPCLSCCSNCTSFGP